jgi:hypothetical protein
MKNTNRVLASIFAVLITIRSGGAQQPQTQLAPIYATNSKYTNGTAPGYWPTAGSGLTLNLSGGTAFCGGAVVQYTASTLTMTASTTNYVYLNTSAACVPAVKTSTFVATDIPVATVTTSGSAITAITDVRTMFLQGSTTGGRTLSCQPGLGDGLNAIPAGTYLQTTCRNETGQTWTLTAIRCVADSGSSTCNVTNGAGTGLLTGAITGTSTYANGTQSGTTTIASGDYLKITFVADGTSKQIGIDVTGTY